MTHPGGEIYVDPDGVIKTGDGYDQYLATYTGHLARIREVRSRYSGSWGDDELGREFGQNFIRGLDAMEQIVETAVGMLQYTAEGLRASGIDYRRADEHAREAGLLLARRGETHLVSHGLPTESSHISDTVTTPRAPAASYLTPLTPALSAHDTRDISGMLVNAERLPQGCRLVALVPLPDGTVQVDANRYESVTPVAASAVTDPQGRPIDPDGRQFFVVRDNPNVDPTAAGYRPLLVAYPTGGDQPVA
ncbi:hypothetical protein GCM10009541_35270 [Micromonospora gifhornensis]|uniref:WXG100 family type VII secretion target n=1 Tax=Micromonospora gifhornensis TaxID=84594 RepID=A0ABQ4IJU3_9ACTN|nr:hypothetical protein [Micromonospora gifhornensis]GIJ18111.1 hypothetical protein Vgi01_47950 [Micromonospora gifhornensis]